MRLFELFADDILPNAGVEVTRITIDLDAIVSLSHQSYPPNRTQHFSAGLANGAIQLTESGYRRLVEAWKSN